MQVKRELKGQTLAGLINNAGIANHAVLMHQPINEFRKVLEINLVGILAVIQVIICHHPCRAVIFKPLLDSLQADNHQALHEATCPT